MKIKRGSTSVRRLIFVADSSSTTGAGLTGLAYNTASFAAYYFAGDLSAEVQITLATATLGSFTSGGVVEVDSTNMPGWYEIGIPDAALDAGNEVAIQLRGAANMVPVNIYIELDTVDYQTARFGAPSTAEINAEVDAALADYDAPTKAELDAAQSSIEAACATATGFAEPGDAMALTTGERSTLAGVIDVAILNQGDGADLIGVLADAIAADWIAGDASPLAIVAAMKADATLAAMIARVDENVSAAKTLTSAYDSAKTAATQASVDTIDAIADKLDSGLEDDGASGWQWTTLAVANVAAASGGDASAANQAAMIEAIEEVSAAVDVVGNKINPAAVSIQGPPGLVDGVLTSLKIGADYTDADAGTNKLDNRITFTQVNLSTLISDATDWVPKFGLRKGSVLIDVDGEISGTLNSATLAFPVTTTDTTTLKSGTYTWDVELWRGTENMPVMTGEVDLVYSAIGR